MGVRFLGRRNYKMDFARIWWCASTLFGVMGKVYKLWAVLIEERCRKGMRQDGVDL